MLNAYRNRILSFISFGLAAVFLVAWTHKPVPQSEQQVSYQPAHKECHSQTFQGINWKYCVYTPAEGTTSGRLAYLLHGRNNSENSWNDETFYTAQIQRLWQQNKVTPPTVVAVSFGPVWLLAPKGKQAASGLLDLFASVVIPTIEKRIGTPRERILFGESMGGINSLILGLKHHSLFKKVAALCAPVYTITPFDSQDVMEKFFQRTGADRETMAGVIQLAKAFFADKQEWIQSEPLEVLKNLDKRLVPELYISCGLYDKYGNYEGAERFAELAKERNAKIQWRPLYGPHCAVDIPSIADFIAN